MICMQDLSAFRPRLRLSQGGEAREADYEALVSAQEDRLRVTVKNTGDTPLRIREIALFSGTAGLPAGVRFYGEGYHMLAQYRGTADHLEIIGSYGGDKDFFHLPDNPYDRDLFILYGMALFSAAGSHLLLAFSSCRRFMGKIRFRRDELEAVLDTEGLVLEPGCAWELEELVLLQGEGRDRLLELLADRINRNHPPMSWPRIPTGWCSYYCMGRMEPQGLYDNARAMAHRIPELGMIQIDAGTNTADGDWLIPRFEEDLAAICGKVLAEGVEAGGYLSPFLVSLDSRLYAEHSDWLVCDEAGNPTTRRSHNPNWCILDGTHPEARDYLRRVVRTMHDACGLRYFKLDFLSYGALPAGQRYDAGKTSVEAYRMAMQAIVEEVGADSFILACNAPFWPTLGLCHGCRTTNDIFRDWKHVRMNALEQFHRNWQHLRLWINDPDCVVLEKLDIERRNGVRPCTLNDDEFEFHKAFAAACGGMILSGDLLEGLSEENLEVLRRLLRAMGTSAVFDGERFAVGRFADKDLLCLFNWDADAKWIEAPLVGEGALFDYWTDAPLGSYRGAVRIQLPPHGGCVIRYEHTHNPGNE